MTVYVCFDKDIECGNRPENWCAGCPKHALRGPSHSMDPARERELQRGPSDSGVQVEAAHDPILGIMNACECARCNPRAAIPVAPSDEQILPPLPDRRALPVLGSGIAGHALGHTADQMREYAIAARALPVAALSDADRDAMEQALCVTECGTAIEYRLQKGCMARDVRNTYIELLEDAIAALRTRLLRHSEGKE